MANAQFELEMAPALPEDSVDVARLWGTSFDDKFGFVLGDRMEDFLTTWLAESPGVYHDTTLARVDGRVVGYIQADGNEPPEMALVKPLWRCLRKEFGVPGAVKRLFQFWYATLENHNPPHVLHIFMVGVEPDWRGRGVAWRLLEHAEEHARACGRTHLRLGVVYGNDGAKRLYERFGFETGPLVTMRLGNWALGHSQYYEMVKEIAPESEA